MTNRDKTTLKTIPWDFPAVQWLRLHTQRPRSGTPQATTTSLNATLQSPHGQIKRQPCSHTDAGAGPGRPRERATFPSQPAVTGPALSEQLGREKPPARPVKPRVSLGGRSSGPRWFQATSVPHCAGHGREPRGPVLTSRPDRPPSQAAACAGHHPSEPDQAGDSQPVRAPFPEKPPQR